MGSTTRERKRWLGLAAWLVATLLAGGVGAALQGPDVAERYAGFDKPPWAPPASLFGPVWSALYALIGVAAWRVWYRDGFSGARTALGLFLAQLLVNAAWSPIFFGLDQPVAALAVIVVLDVLVILTMLQFAAHDRIAAALLAPYLAWILFATALNASIAF